MATRFYLRSEGPDLTVLYRSSEDPQDTRLKPLAEFDGPPPPKAQVEEVLGRCGYKVVINAIERRSDGDGWQIFYSSPPVRDKSRATERAGGTSKSTRDRSWKHWAIVGVGGIVLSLIFLAVLPNSRGYGSSLGYGPGAGYGPPQPYSIRPGIPPNINAPKMPSLNPPRKPWITTYMPLILFAVGIGLAYYFDKRNDSLAKIGQAMALAAVPLFVGTNI